MATTSIFAAAKAAAPASTAKAGKEKQVISVNLGDKLTQLQEARDEIKVLEAKAKMLEGDIAPVAREQFMALVNKHKMKPESFVLESSGGKMLVIMQDRYLKVTEAKEKALQENGLGDVIEEKTTFAFDSELLAKYEKQISDAISKIKGIPDEDKSRLITASVEKSVKKGTIDRLATFENPQVVFSLIEPVLQLKNQ